MQYPKRTQGLYLPFTTLLHVKSFRTIFGLCVPGALVHVGSFALPLRLRLPLPLPLHANLEGEKGLYTSLASSEAEESSA